MIVLGVHGWEGTHDAAAALLVDGGVAVFIEEERLNRQKHAMSCPPVLAAHAALQQQGLNWADVDCVAYGWDMPRYLCTHGSAYPFSSDRQLLERVFRVTGDKIPTLCWFGHHESHAASAFYGSGWETAAVVVVDGQGEDKSISLYSGGPGGLTLIRDWPPACSLGFLYEAATEYCGFGFLDAGKTMGLAAFGNPRTEALPLKWRDSDFHSPLETSLEERAVLARWHTLLRQRFGPPPEPPRKLDRQSSGWRWIADEPARHAPDVAAAAQRTVEEALVGLIEYAQRVTGHRRVALAGGVALNCVANGRLALHCDELYVPPCAHDAGAALGAAMLAARQGGDIPQPVTSAAMGMFYSDDEIISTWRAGGWQARPLDDVAQAAAEHLAAGEILGWFQGASEVGPRALGFRSILALPSPEGQHARVNRIKGRELWRPLAPSALADETPWMFGCPVDSKFMLRSLSLTDQARTRLPAVAHVDGSTRVQTIQAMDGLYGRLLHYIREATGRGVVLNTSFNAPGEPIVCSPADAIRTFSTMGLDALVLGNWLLTKGNSLSSPS